MLTLNLTRDMGMSTKRWQSVSNRSNCNIFRVKNQSTHGISNRRPDIRQHYRTKSVTSWSSSSLKRCPSPSSHPFHSIIPPAAPQLQAKLYVKRGRNALNPYPVPHCSILVRFSCNKLLSHASNSCLESPLSWSAR